MLITSTSLVHLADHQDEANPERELALGSPYPYPARLPHLTPRAWLRRRQHLLVVSAQLRTRLDAASFRLVTGHLTDALRSTTSPPHHRASLSKLGHSSSTQPFW